MTSNSSPKSKPAVPYELAYRWHKIVTLATEELKTLIALITCQTEEGLVVFCTNPEARNPFQKGDTCGALLDLDLQLLRSQQEALHISDLNAEAAWQNHPLTASGFRYYFGKPLRWSNGDIYGTFSVYDVSLNPHAEAHQKLFAEFCHEIEQDLVILQQQEALRGEIARRRQVEAELANFTPKEFHALWHAAQAVLAHRKFDVAARVIFDEACSMTGATAGYVALLNEDGSENQVVFLEAGGATCTVDPSLPMPIRGLRAEAYHTGKAVYDNDFMKSEWIKLMPEGHAPLKNVMFAPLNIDDKTVGIMGLANKDSDFTDFDATVAAALSEVAAISLKNSRNLDLLDETNKRLETFNQALVEREMRIIEVKQEVNQLCQALGRAPVYAEIAANFAG